MAVDNAMLRPGSTRACVREPGRQTWPGTHRPSARRGPALAPHRIGRAGLCSRLGSVRSDCAAARARRRRDSRAFVAPVSLPPVTDARRGPGSRLDGGPVLQAIKPAAAACGFAPGRADRNVLVDRAGPARVPVAAGTPGHELGAGT